MKKITIIGIGTCRGTVTAEGLRAIESADALIGGKLSSDWFAGLNKKMYDEWEAEKTRVIIENETAENIAVLVSGDVGFYSGAERLSKTLSAYEVTLLPGVSTVSAFFAKIKLPWKEAKLVSMHGDNQNIVGAVRRNKYTFCLTAKDKAYVADKLTEYGLGDIQTFVGENLGGESERVFETTARRLRELTRPDRTVLVFVNPNPDGRIRFGIPDGEFQREENIPMTKAEVRAVTLSKLGVRPTDACLDIGCGTGSVTVELALSAYEGKVFALDRSETAIELTTRNCRRFQVGNVTAQSCNAFDAIPALPVCERAFIGGSGGELEGIFDALFQRNPNIRIAVNAVTPDTLNRSVAAFEKRGITPEVVQIGVTRVEKLFAANNPVFIISGGR